MGVRRLPLAGLTAAAGLFALPAAAQITITTGSTEVTSPITTTGGTAAVTLSGQGATLVNRSSLSSASQAVLGSGSFTGQTVNNFGSITTSSSSSAAVLFTTGTSQSVINNAGASITGASGVAFVGGSSGAVSLVNAGTITATGGSSGNAISLFNSGGTLTNSGTITATGNAISTFTNANLAQIVNSGTITSTGTGSNGAALSLNGASSTTNSGSITGATGISLQASSFSGIGHTITNTAAGTITGTTAAIDNQSGAPLTLINAGTISGAIKLGSAGDTVSITGGKITGDITGRNVAGESVQFALGSNGSFTTGGSITGVNSVAVQSGTLTIANPITGGSSFAIASGATAILGSSLGASTISNAGTLQLNGSQTVTGSYTQTGTLSVKLSDAGRSSVGSPTLTVAGPAQLSGAKIAVAIDPNNTRLVTANQQFTVLSATSLSVSGTPTVTTTNNAFVFTPSQVGNSEVVTAVVDTVSSPLAKLSRNGSASAGVAGAILGILNGGFAISDDLSRAISVLVSLPSSQLSSALTSLSPNTGSTTGATTGTLVSVGGGNTTISTRLQQARTGGDQLTSAGPQYWVQGFGGSLTQGVRDGFAGFVADSYGMILGGDRAVGDSLRLGLAGGITRVDVSADSSRAGDTAAVNGYLVNLYGSWSPGPYYVDGMVMAGINDNSTQRQIPLFGLTAKGSYDSYQTGLRVNAGLPQRLAGFTVTPNAFAQYSFLTRDGYTETRAGGLGLRARGQDTNAAQLGVGVRVQHPFTVERGTAVPELRLNYIREVGDDRVPLTAAFVGGGAAFVTSGPSIPRDNFNVGAGATFYELRDLSVSLNYDYLTNDAYSAHTGTIRLRAAF